MILILSTLVSSNILVHAFSLLFFYLHHSKRPKTKEKQQRTKINEIISACRHIKIDINVSSFDKNGVSFFGIYFFRLALGIVYWQFLTFDDSKKCVPF